MLFELAAGCEYPLSDYEAGLFLPHLLARLADKQKRFRDSARDIMRKVCEVYPVSKYLPLVHEVTLNQASILILGESVDELERLVASFGLGLLKVRAFFAFSL